MIQLRQILESALPRSPLKQDGELDRATTPHPKGCSADI